MGTTCLPGHLGELRASGILRWEGPQGSASFKGAGGSLGPRPCQSGDIKGPGRGARSRPALRLQREWPASPALPWVQRKAPHGDPRAPGPHPEAPPLGPLGSTFRVGAHCSQLEGVAGGLLGAGIQPRPPHEQPVLTEIRELLGPGWWAGYQEPQPRWWGVTSSTPTLGAESTHS